MAASTKISKDQLLKLIDGLEKNPNDKVRVLGDVGISVVGAGLGAAAAGTLAAAAGATSILGVTSAAGALGVTVVAATPVGWVLGSAAAAGAAAYGVSRLIKNGSLSEGRKAELLNRYRDEAREAEAKETAGTITDDDRTKFIVSLRELIEKELMPADLAFRLIEQVERGGLPISKALVFVGELLGENELGSPQKTKGLGSSDLNQEKTRGVQSHDAQSNEDDAESIEVIVCDPLRFKSKLAIGENAYQELRNANAVRKYWDLFGAVGGGAAIAKSSVIASTFFAPKGIIGLLGIGTAATPLGWVIAAGAVSGLAWYGVMHALGSATEDRVTVIPKFINTPLDIIGAKLFDLMMPLALKVAAADGPLNDSERGCIQKYFVQEWGYDARFVSMGMALIEPRLDQFKISAVADDLVAYKKTNPDCNYEVMSRDLIAFLREVMNSDGIVDEREELVLLRVQAIFDNASKVNLTETIGEIAEDLTAKAKVGAKAVASSAHKLSVAAFSKADEFVKSETFGTIKDGVGKGADVASESIRNAAGKAATIAGAWRSKLRK